MTLRKKIENIIVGNSFNPIHKYVIDDSHCSELADQICSLIKERLDKIADDCPNCDNSGYTVAQVEGREYVTRDMASDAGDLSLEGSLYREEEFEQEQCQWCYETKNSRFNIDNLIKELT